MRFEGKRIFVISLALAFFFIGGGMLLVEKNMVSTANLDSRTFIAGVTQSIDELRPALFTKHEEKLVSSAIFEGLVCYDEKEQVVKPLLAKSWKYTNKGKELNIKLKSNVKFHNGKKLTARDVKASWENNFDITKEWANISMYLSIAGANERLEGKTAQIDGIEVVNDYNLRIKFDKVNAAFIYVLTNPMFWVMDITDDNNLAAGTGPYVLKEYSPEQCMLIRNDEYHRSQPCLSGIKFIAYKDQEEALKQYKEGKLDYLDSIPLKEIKNIKESKEYKGLLLEKPLMETYCLGFNLNREPYRECYYLRRAINYAIDRKAIINNFIGGGYIPLKGGIPCGLKGYSKEMCGYTYNPDRAKQLLEEAGYPGGKGLKPLTLTCNSGSGHRLVAEEIARQLANIGLLVQVQEEDWNYYKKQLNKMKYSFFRLSWQADYPDADNFIYSLFHSSKIGVSNLTSYYNPQVDKILDGARAEFNEEERLKNLKKAEEIIIDDAPYVWLFQKNACRLFSSDVNSLELDSMGMIDWYEVELLKPQLDDVEKV